MRVCQDAEDDWDDGEEMEVANDTMKTIEAKLPLQIGDLTVTALGEVVADKAGYWNKSYIFPIGYSIFLHLALYFNIVYHLSHLGLCQRPTLPLSWTDAAVRYTCTRKYVTDEESKQETEFLCQIEADDDGPVFRVTPKDDQGQLLQVHPLAKHARERHANRPGNTRSLAILIAVSLVPQGHLSLPESSRVRDSRV